MSAEAASPARGITDAPTGAPSPGEMAPWPPSRNYRGTAGQPAESCPGRGAHCPHYAGADFAGRREFYYCCYCPANWYEPMEPELAAKGYRIWPPGTWAAKGDGGEAGTHGPRFPSPRREPAVDRWYGTDGPGAFADETAAQARAAAKVAEDFAKVLAKYPEPEAKP